MTSSGYDYDLFVIGAGSGGVRAARLAGQSGKKVGIAEEYRFGGTCVIRGCVPKKLLVYAAQFGAAFDESKGFGWHAEGVGFDWSALRRAKDTEISRLEGLYRLGLSKAGVVHFQTRAMLAGPNHVRLATGETITARHILIAVGAEPNYHTSLPGHAHCITTNQVFDLPELPKKALIYGGGYIAVEFANIFHGLGVDTTLVYRGEEILKRFDHSLRQDLYKALIDQGIRVILQDSLESVQKTSNGTLSVSTSCGESIETEAVLLAIGRRPNTANLGLETVNIGTDARGAISVNAYSETSAPGIYAVGDVTDRAQLTPVAIHEAVCLIETLYGSSPVSPDHDMIATAVFSHPEIGTVGLSEDAARQQYALIDIYETRFRPMKATLSGAADKMMMKLVVDGQTQRVLGAHILGEGAGEMVQLLAISLKAGLTKAAFDATMAVHPTACEELVTMYQPTRQITQRIEA